MPAEKKPAVKKTAAKKTAAPKAPVKKAPVKKTAAKKTEPTALTGAVTPPASPSPAPEVNQAPAKKQGFFMKLFGKKS